VQWISIGLDGGFFDRLTFSEFQNAFGAFKTPILRRSMIELG